MRRNLVLFAVLLFASLNALGQSRQPARFANRLLDDVVQMSRAQLPEETVLAFVRARQARLETDVTADDLIRLHRTGVSDRVVAYIASISGLENRPAERDRDPGVSYDSDGSSAAPVDPGDGDVAVEPEPYGPVYGGWGWGWGGYPYWYDYSPFFYGGVVIRGGGRFHDRGHGRDGGGHRDHGHSSHGGSRGSSGGHHGGGSHGGGSHGGGGHR